MCMISRRDFIKGSAALGVGVLAGGNILNSASQAAEVDFDGGRGEIRSGKWFRHLGGGVVQCTLCPLMEKLEPGKTGACRVRVSRGGKINVTNYGKPASMHLDPLEKNPVYHFTPGVRSLALATAGCNLACPACQNWEISQRGVSQVKSYKLSPKEAVYYAGKNGCKALTYTFSEPVIFFEYLLDIATLARSRGMTNHVVSGGYVNKEPLEEMCGQVDSFVVSIKGAKDSCYGGRPGVFDVIKNTLVTIKGKGKWLEVAVLVTPTINDDENWIRDWCKWVKGNLGEFTPVHFSRFYPSFRLENLPQTPVSTLERAQKIAFAEGIKYAYIGNVPGHVGNNTFCHNCGKLLIQRVGFRVLKNDLVGGNCKYCKTRIPGIWA